MMRAYAALILTAFSGAHALDISGKVFDKRFAPIAGATICNASAPDNCVLSGPDGTFHLTGNVGLQMLASASSFGKAPSRYSADGRSLYPLESGRSGLLGRWGRTWPGIFFSGPGSAMENALDPTIDRSYQPGPSAKSSAQAALLVSKSGYAATTVALDAEIGKDQGILLAGEGESVSVVFNGKSLDGWTQIPTASWQLKDSGMASTGAARGEIYSKDDYLDFRVIFSVRQISGNHAPCVLFFTQRPPAGQNGLDALGAVQWQPPGTGRWDYRPGKNNEGGALFTIVSDPKLSRNQWNQCELLAHGSTGEARMACCQETAAGPCKAKEMLRFKDPTAGRKGPFAIQMHNAGIYDEYRNISIETDPKSDSLFITR